MSGANLNGADLEKANFKNAFIGGHRGVFDGTPASLPICCTLSQSEYVQDGYTKVGNVFKEDYSSPECQPPNKSNQTDTKKNTQEAEKNLIVAEKYLTANRARENDKIQITNSGLQYRVFKEGIGAKPISTDEVKIIASGRLIDGTIIDMKDGNKPLVFPLNRMIKGWIEGIQLMNKGAKYEFFIHPNLGFGNRKRLNIPPNSLLIYIIELIDINPNKTEVSESKP